MDTFNEWLEKRNLQENILNRISNALRGGAASAVGSGVGLGILALAGLTFGLPMSAGIVAGMAGQGALRRWLSTASEDEIAQHPEVVQAANKVGINPEELAIRAKKGMRS